MKRIGLIGGLSWQSTVDYYRIINEESAKRLGGLNNVESIVYSVNLNEMLEHMGKGEVEILGGKFAAVGKKLEEAGADLIVLCTNTMHAACAQLEESIHVPFIHIADATADEIKRLGLHKVGLMGTPFTMGQDFYKGRLRDKHGIEVIVPQESEWNEIYRVIQEELTFGILKDESRKYFLSVIEIPICRCWILLRCMPWQRCVWQRNWTSKKLLQGTAAMGCCPCFYAEKGRWERIWIDSSGGTLL